MHDLDFGVVLIGVRERSVVNVPDEQSASRQKRVEASQLPIFDEEVLLAIRVAIGPKTVGFESGLDVLKGDLVVLGLRDGFNPSLILLAPCRV